MENEFSTGQAIFFLNKSSLWGTQNNIIKCLSRFYLSQYIISFTDQYIYSCFLYKCFAWYSTFMLSTICPPNQEKLSIRTYRKIFQISNLEFLSFFLSFQHFLRDSVQHRSINNYV